MGRDAHSDRTDSGGKRNQQCIREGKRLREKPSNHKFQGRRLARFVRPFLVVISFDLFISSAKYVCVVDG